MNKRVAMMRRILLGGAFFGVLMMNCVCTHRDTDMMKEDLCALKQHKIVLPLNQMECIIESHTNSVSEHSLLRLIVYSDSASCSSCAVDKLYMWTDFCQRTEVYKNELDYGFIFCPKSKDRIDVEFAISTLRHFNHSVYVDTLGLFERFNPYLSKNPRLHTFLLDENNNVLLVGNPLENEKIEEMFWQIVEERLGKRESK